MGVIVRGGGIRGDDSTVVVMLEGDVQMRR